ncbi:MAG TPA: hypothetical protein VGX25_05615 [Actinophytocola sp.]|uniref:hypothetical protein n=1 Tax=Actinophytocola sp. TaxID=1872138 RepID=UPI002DDCAECC|nr:hypothetical protein [Actinophytocola sp.]HEV2778861.1 hypothetical protein [Actinophytocola sp.]
MVHPERDVDAAMRRAVAACLPDREPPIGLRIDRVIRLGRRRTMARRLAVPVAAAVVTALVLAVSRTVGMTDPDPGPPPAIGASEIPSSALPPATLAYRLPAGHSWDEAANRLARGIAEALPPEHVATYVGSRSDQIGGGARYGYGFHTLWRDGQRYGYLMWLHRTKGEYPATAYGLPVEPCVEPYGKSPAYHCAPVAVPEGGSAYSFDVDSGYRMRGIVWDSKDPNGGADIRVTIAFYLPTGGAWTPFPVLDDHPTLTAIPMSIDELARLIGIPG